MDNNSSSPFLFFYCPWSQSSGSWENPSIIYAFFLFINNKELRRNLFLFPSAWETVTQILQFIDCLPKLSLNNRKKYISIMQHGVLRLDQTNIFLIKQLNKYCWERREIFTQHFQYLQKKFTLTFGDYLWTN